MIGDQAYLLSYSSDLKKMFVRHFVYKSILSLFYTTVFAFLGNMILTIRFNFEGTNRLLVALSPFISIFMYLSQNSQLLRLIVIAGSLWLLWPKVIFFKLLSYDVSTQTYYIISLIALYKMTNAKVRYQPLSYTYTSRLSSFKLSCQSCFSRNIVIFVILFFWNVKQLTVLAYLNVILEFYSCFNGYLLNEEIEELHNPQILTAVALNLSMYLSHRVKLNLDFFSGDNKNKALECLYRNRLDSYIITQVYVSLQKLLLESTGDSGSEVLIEQAIYLQNAAKTVQKSYFGQDEMKHIFESDEAISVLYCIYDFLFYVFYDLGIRLFNDKVQLERLKYIYEKFSRIYEQNLMQQLKYSDNASLDLDEGGGHDGGRLFGIDLDEDGGLETGAEGNDIGSTETRRIRDVRVTHFALIRAFFLRQVTLDDLIRGTASEKLQIIEEDRKRIKELKAKRRTQFLLDLVQFKWGRRFFQSILSSRQDVLILKHTISMMMQTLLLLKGSDQYLVCKEHTLDIMRFIVKQKDRRLLDAVSTAILAFTYES